MLYFRVKGFYTAESTRESGFNLAPKQEWQMHESGREFTILDVMEFVLVAGLPVDVPQGISVRYLWRDKDSTVSHSVGYQFAERQTTTTIKDTSAV